VPQDFFTTPLPVERGCVEVVDAQFEGSLDDGNTIGHRLGAEFRATVEPGTPEANLTDLPV
jgi:hypothetical protein